MSQKPLQYIRYILEIIAFPFFCYLVFHFGAHGSEELLNSFPESQKFLENFPAFNILLGVFFLGIFTWIWRQPKMKRWTPCAHEHCHEGTKYLHFFAITAFCLHFFPEAVIRHELINSTDTIISLSAYIGFLTHFVIDVVTGIMLSAYWEKTYQKVISFGGMASIWLTAFFIQTDVFEFFPPQAEGIILIIGAFLLAMFVHLPHKPVVHCTGCKK